MPQNQALKKVDQNRSNITQMALIDAKPSGMRTREAPLQHCSLNGRYWDRTSDNLLVREVLYR